MVDIHKELGLTVSAPENQRLGTGLFAGLLVRDLLADRTHIPSVLYDQFITHEMCLQYLLPAFHETCLIIH